MTIGESLNAATYYVNATGGDDSRNTTVAQNPATPWLTLTKARQNVAPADIVRVADGTYERLELFSTNSGTAGNWINWVGNATGTGVVTRGWTINTGVGYHRFIGFEATHPDTSHGRAGIRWFGDCHHLEWVDCYLHELDQEISHAAGGSSPSYITFRNVTGYWAGHPNELQEGNSFISLSAAGTPLVTAWQFLIEYCHVQRVVDFSNLYGTNHIVRNNWVHDFRDAYWTVVGHPDMFQPGSEQTQNGTRHHVYERCFLGDSPSEHSHFGIWQDYEIDYGDTNHLIRGHVTYEIGGGGIGNIGTDKMQTYNNTFYWMNEQNNGSVWSWNRDLTDNAGSIGGMLINSVISVDWASDGNAIFIDTDNFVEASHNWGHDAGTEASFLGTSDPLFVNPATQNFHLQAGSPLINVGRYVTTITTADGSGTTFDVAHSHVFFDGWGRVEGDIITTGGTTVRITGMTNFTVFVSASVSWTNNQPVYWGTDTAPDIGGLPFGSTDLTAATMLRSGTTYTVTPTGDARGVWFYVDGIPTTWDYDAPYQQTFASGTVTAKAYALYAQAWPVVNATDLGEAGSAPYRNKGQSTRSAGVIP